MFKEVQYIKDLSEFLACPNCVRAAEGLKINCRLSKPNSKQIQKDTYNLLSQIENISSQLRKRYSNIDPNTIEQKHEEYEFFSYNSMRYKDVKIIKTTPPSIKSNSRLNIITIEETP